MRKLILIVHTSLDGFVAGTHGELDGFDPGEENLAFVCQITETADTALFGRVSFQLLDGDWPTVKDRLNASGSEVAYSNWYNAAHKIVVSKSLQGTKLRNTTILSENIPEEINRLKEQPGNDILIFGSPTVTQTLIQDDLIDEYWIFINPVMFGKGIPLFAELKERRKLDLKEMRQFPNGEIALHYVHIGDHNEE
jgi:dihydrofolate reductase